MNPDEASVSVVHKAAMLERSADGTMDTAVEIGPECGIRKESTFEGDRG